MARTYQFEELDAETREYLIQARDRRGKGMPGIFASKSNYWPVIGLVSGFGVMIATLLATVSPTDPPTKEALLQTAGFVLGGWMVIAALRVWAGGKSGKYAGHFVYADPETLYHAKGGSVEVIDLTDLRDARAVQNFNEGKYQNTTITVKVGRERETVQVHDEERGRRMTVYLNAVAYMRDGGEDGKDHELLSLSPEAMGAVAKEVVRTGEFPRNLGETEDGAGERIPRPRKEGRRSTGLLAMLVTVLAGGVMFVGFRAVNAPVRDEAVFSRVQSLPPKDQPPALRLYLANPDFRAHRDEAQRLLDGHYDNGVRAFVNGMDPDMKQGLSEVVLALKSKPLPVVSLVTAEDQAPPGQEGFAAGREKLVQTVLADKWGSTIGDELVVFAAPSNPDRPDETDKSVHGMIDLRWKYQADGSIVYTIEFRKSPDDPPVAAKTSTVPPNGDADQAVRTLADHILQMTVGGTRLRPPPVLDF